MPEHAESVAAGKSYRPALRGLVFGLVAVGLCAATLGVAAAMIHAAPGSLVVP